MYYYITAPNFATVVTEGKGNQQTRFISIIGVRHHKSDTQMTSLRARVIITRSMQIPEDEVIASILRWILKIKQSVLTGTLYHWYIVPLCRCITNCTLYYFIVTLTRHYLKRIQRFSLNKCIAILNSPSFTTKRLQSKESE